MIMVSCELCNAPASMDCHNQGHNFQEMAVDGAFMFHKHILFHIVHIF